MASTESRILRAAEFIRANLAQRITLGTIAALLGISRFTLSRSFRSVMHVSFRQYLLQHRIQWACLLLQRRDRSITDIALMVGFGDLPRFDKVFKRQTGLSPSDYRKKLLAKAATLGTTVAM